MAAAEPDLFGINTSTATKLERDFEQQKKDARMTTDQVEAKRKKAEAESLANMRKQAAAAGPGKFEQAVKASAARPKPADAQATDLDARAKRLAATNALIQRYYDHPKLAPLLRSPPPQWNHNDEAAAKVLLAEIRHTLAARASGKIVESALVNGISMVEQMILKWDMQAQLGVPNLKGFSATLAKNADVAQELAELTVELGDWAASSAHMRLVFKLILAARAYSDAKALSAVKVDESEFAEFMEANRQK